MELPYINNHEYNPNYGDDRICECGHEYHRHFDSYEDMYACGCKYCNCYEFTEKTNDEIFETLIKEKDTTGTWFINYIKKKDNPESVHIHRYDNVDLDWKDAKKVQHIETECVAYYVGPSEHYDYILVAIPAYFAHEHPAVYCKWPKKFCKKI